MTESKIYTIEEVKKHNTESDCWVVIHDKVYDVTNFLPKHPGGVACIMNEAGSYATGGFENVPHSEGARRCLQKFYVGHIAEKDQECQFKHSSSSPPEQLTNSSYKWIKFSVPSAVLLTGVYAMSRYLRRR